MKTIRQIAEEIGVSKQAVYKRFKGKLYKTVLPHVRIVDGTAYILEQGERIIKQDFSQDSISYGAHTQDTLILMLQKELEIKNKQIEELTATVKIQASNTSYTPRKKWSCWSKETIRRKKTSAPMGRLLARGKGMIS